MLKDRLGWTNYKTKGTRDEAQWNLGANSWCAAIACVDCAAEPDNAEKREQARVIVRVVTVGNNEQSQQWWCCADGGAVLCLSSCVPLIVSL